MTVLRWTTFLLLVKVSSQSACGDTHSKGDCNCLQHSDGTWAVDCTGRGLSALPGGIPVNTTRLDAAKNNISEISNDTLLRLQYLFSIVLDFNNLTSLPKFPKRIEFMYLSSNKLQHIDPEAFAEVGMIVVLRLDNNLLKEIPLAVYNLNVTDSLIISMNFIDLSSNPNRSIFSHSPRKLIIAKNEIQSISRNYFSGLKSLEQILIYLNKISYIEDKSFSGTSLTHLYIYGNIIQKITSEMFEIDSGSLQYIYLFNNPIEEMDEGALSHLKPNSTVYLECGNLEYIPSKIAEHTHAICVTNKTELNFYADYYSSMYLYGMTCTGLTCHPCGLGLYGMLVRSGCYTCPAGGFYQDNRGYVKSGNYKTDCKRCINGTFSPHPGGTSIFACQSCPSGTNTDVMAELDACPCLENFYRTYRYGACKSCPEGVDCSGGYQNLSEGYGWSWNFTRYPNRLDEYRQFVHNLTTSNFELSEPNTLNYTVYTGDFPVAHKCPRSESCLGGIEAKCLEGYSVNVWLCAECSDNYYELFDKCYKCQDKAIMITVLILVILAIVCVSYLVWRLDKRRGETIRNDSFVIHLKIAINFYQVLGILSEVNEIHWPDSFQSVGESVQYLDIIRYINILSPRCIFPGVWNAYTFLYIAIATPFTIILSTSIIFLIWNLYKRYKEDHYVHRLTDTFLSITMMLLYLTYANTCSNILAVGPWSVRTFNVTKDGDEKRVLTSDYSIDIDESNGSKYETNRNIVYGSLVYVIGFPLAIILILYRRYTRHGERSGTMGMRFFCKQYSPKFWYWEAIDMYSKAILALIANFKDDQPSNMSYSLFITVILIALHLYLEPLEEKSDQKFQLLTLVFIIVNLSVGAIVDIEESGEHSVYSTDDTISVLHDITPYILLLLNLSILFVVFVDLLKKVKESFWRNSTGLKELRNVANDLEDHENDRNQLSPLLQDFDSLSTCNPTINN
ncbi:uncharacterized protein LOC117116795 [Anneissia japonica]|uniref:uncharacterized protein LOC117116795 n=1 Tax=Anneissia japonica TaxID=1529436 RepID=UPI0014258A93|nr:uncharacterized protein LOC117116795 [Anneissia japonica]